MEFDNINKTVRKKQGNIGVARAVYEYTKLGYTVLVPLSDSDKYDLVIDDGHGLKRVQVKTSGFVKHDSYEVRLETSGGNTKIHTRTKRKEDDYDILFVLVNDGRCWSIPTNNIHSYSTMCVGKTKYQEFEIK